MSPVRLVFRICPAALVACGHPGAAEELSMGPGITSMTVGSTSGDAGSTSTGSEGVISESGTGEDTGGHAVCGNGILEDGEGCDDGNGEDSDACPGTCMPAACGDGFLWSGVEECDDGNPSDADECPSSCIAAACGDGLVQAGVEACDDANDDDTDACTSLCRIAACGDGFVYPDVETCDEAGETATCDADCTSAACGDGHRNAAAGEECDDGNQSLLDNCYPSCKAPAMLVFVTSQRYQGDLGGVDGADKKCQTLAQSAKLSGTFKAWLWTEKSGPQETFYHSPGQYMRLDKAVVADNFHQLYYGPHIAGLTITETKQNVENLEPKEDYHSWLFLWTGYNSSRDVSGGGCKDWTSASSEDAGAVSGVYWPFGFPGLWKSLNCGLLHLPILCVQQAWYPEVPKPG